MAEELKHLLDAIQKEGVEKADAEAERIVTQAQHKARDIIQEAEQRAEQITKDAEKNAATFHERSVSEIKHAARDVVISLVRDIEHVLREIVKDSVAKSMDEDTLKEILVTIANTYVEHGFQDKESDIYLSKDEAQRLSDFFRHKLRERMGKGVTVHISDSMSKGFRISFRDEQFYHDFTEQAITDEICRFLQPELEKIVRAAVSEQEDKEGTG